ncbi:hypothetical protein RvY_07337-2 [Ramazzottius varieornatus]|uniref:Maelstrom domain-containing protein n=2 Tax=Ramazzottius varieornatus TaxID=947166 RepID=A0A1D1VB94_RAMVA|nr:hypothetical protein RvY_07337-2 [Ramazzottius varieornatus]
MGGKTPKRDGVQQAWSFVYFRKNMTILYGMTLSEGSGDYAYHVFVDLDTTLMENPHDAEVWPWGFGLHEDRIQPAIKEAWNQSFFKHNIPFVRANFETESRKVFPVISHLNKHYNGWDEHARKKLPFNKNYAEIYKTIVELGSENATNGEHLLVFTKLQEAEMVERYLKWLHEQAFKKLGADSVPKVSFEVCSLEHLAWQAGSILGMAPTEKTIEQALANHCQTEDFQFKCGFHQSKPPSFICARAATVTNVEVQPFCLAAAGFPVAANGESLSLWGHRYPNAVVGSLWES